MKGEYTTEHLRMKSQQRERMNENDEMVWNGSVGMVMDKSVIEVIERKNGMGMDGIEWIENMDANGNEKQRCVVMRVMELKQEGKEDGIMKTRV